MRVLVPIVVAAAACAGSRASPPPRTSAAVAHPRAAGPDDGAAAHHPADAPSREVFTSDAPLDVLRGLVPATEGGERLAVQQRLYVALLGGNDAARAEARAIVEDMVASPAFAAYARADEVLFDRGTMLADEGRRDDARATWQRLVREHPSSRYAPDAHVALADLSFEDVDLAAAEIEYRAALQTPRAPVAGYARYKLGWTHYNLQRFDEALADFVAVARTASEPVRREALRDVVRVYAELRPVADAMSFFDGLAHGEGPALTLRLARTYRDQGRYDDAAVALRVAIPLLERDDACEAAEDVAELARAAGAQPEVQAAEQALADRRLTDCPASP